MVIAFWGSHSGGGGTPVSVYPVIELLSRADILLSLKRGNFAK